MQMPAVTERAIVPLTESEVAFHRATEAGSVFIVAPFLAYLAWKGYGLPSWARVGLGGLVAALLVVDGGLLLRWPERFTRLY